MNAFSERLLVRDQTLGAKVVCVCTILVSLLC